MRLQLIVFKGFKNRKKNILYQTVSCRSQRAAAIVGREKIQDMYGHSSSESDRRDCGCVLRDLCCGEWDDSNGTFQKNNSGGASKDTDMMENSMQMQITICKWTMCIIQVLTAIYNRCILCKEPFVLLLVPWAWYWDDPTKTRHHLYHFKWNSDTHFPKSNYNYLIWVLQNLFSGYC